MLIISFIGMCLAWSFSWFAMKLQVESFVPLEVSVLYRFVITSVLMFILCFFARQRMMLNRNEWRFMPIIGLCNFCINFLLGYYAVHYIPSGVLATIFSLSIIASEIISALINKRKIEKKIFVSSFLGTAGLAFFILPLVNFGAEVDGSKILVGLILSVTATLVYSFGNVIIAKNKTLNATPLYTSIAYGSAIGSAFLLIFNLLLGNEFIFDFSSKYLLSFSYLVVVASVVAFICLFYMIQHVGSTRANYSSLVYPVLALITSSYLEGFQFTILSSVGFVMILSALLVEFLPKNMS